MNALIHTTSYQSCDSLIALQDLSRHKNDSSHSSSPHFKRFSISACREGGADQSNFSSTTTLKETDWCDYECHRLSIPKLVAVALTHPTRTFLDLVPNHAAVNVLNIDATPAAGEAMPRLISHLKLMTVYSFFMAFVSLDCLGYFWVLNAVSFYQSAACQQSIAPPFTQNVNLSIAPRDTQPERQLGALTFWNRSRTPPQTKATP